MNTSSTPFGARSLLTRLTMRYAACMGEARLARSARAVVELHSPGVAYRIEFHRIGQDDGVLHGRNGGGTAMLNSRRMAVAITLAVLGLSVTLMGSPGRTARAAG